MPVALWPDGARLGRLVHSSGLIALEQLGRGTPGKLPEVDLGGEHGVFLFFQPRRPEPSAALLIELPRWDTHAFVCWCGSRRARPRQICRRLAWWTWNEAWWRPGSIQMPWQVAHWLCDDGVERFGREPWLDQLDEQVLGTSVFDPEAYQLLEEPAPPLWPLEEFVAARRAQDHGGCAGSRA